MERQKVISFEREEGHDYITVGEMKKHLEKFDTDLPIFYIHEAGYMPLTKGKGEIVKYDEYIDDIIDEEDIDDNGKCIDILLLQ